MPMTVGCLLWMIVIDWGFFFFFFFFLPNSQVNSSFGWPDHHAPPSITLGTIHSIAFALLTR
jgi:hypothetical protein